MKLSKVSSRIATVVRSRRVPLKNNPRGYDAMVPRVVRLARIDLSVSRSSHASFRFSHSHRKTPQNLRYRSPHTHGHRCIFFGGRITQIPVYYYIKPFGGTLPSITVLVRVQALRVPVAIHVLLV